ncbi:DUF6371 domain-containing protein [Hymenobacter sp. BT491]|uniref:DUF6371 domain-containing protein n=1 Tax=Hymenobacter sp. BT491 TaxID=2766779 RepID=UPI00165383E7|nr:DUF6371 domain-containing protein [Hymenobacter sp. BT491]MBC6991675.1 toprim domain-containing protein [Hymenobacter sp. BT491]
MFTPTTSYRYTLQPYDGPRSRTTCPSCDKPRCFSRYLDSNTGEVLPPEFGRCDHVLSCGYHRNPYHGGADGQSYAQQVHHATKQGYPVGPHRAPSPSRPLTKPSPIVSIPEEVFTATLGHYEHNVLACVLCRHFGQGVADELLSRFRLGTSTHWPGACVFWLLDEQGRIRGGQVVLYDETGHTVKEPRRCTTWAHTALSLRCKSQGRPKPAWLADYEKHSRKSPCLFGLPQLVTTPAEQPVALVESAKTAMVATSYLPEFVWLATMGLNFLTPDRLEPLRGRRIVLFPDAGALAKWQAKAKELRRSGFDVRISDALEKLVTDEERRSGLDLADVLLRESLGYPPSWDE